MTPGDDLFAKHVIHAVGPGWTGGAGQESRILESCYSNALMEAQRLSVRSIAFPCINTGVSGYPAREAAEIAVDTVRGFLRDTAAALNVVFCCFTQKDTAHYNDILGTHSKHCCEISSFVADENSRQAIKQSLSESPSISLAKRLPPPGGWTIGR